MTHRYRASVSWTGTTGVGYDAYSRQHSFAVPGVDVGTTLSGDPAFGGDGTLLNPEQLLAVAAASCQLLSFLAVAARARVDAVGYTDDAVGEMPDDRITTIELQPVITVRGAVTDDRLRHWVEVAHRECYIANSLTTRITVRPTFRRG